MSFYLYIYLSFEILIYQTIYLSIKIYMFFNYRSFPKLPPPPSSLFDNSLIDSSSLLCKTTFFCHIQPSSLPYLPPLSCPLEAPCQGAKREQLVGLPSLMRLNNASTHALTHTITHTRVTQQWKRWASCSFREFLMRATILKSHSDWWMKEGTRCLN